MTCRLSRAPFGSGVFRATRSLRTMYLLLMPLVVGVGIAILPSMALKLAAVVGLAGVVLAVIMARRRIVLDPAWVIVAQLYGFTPLGVLLLEWGVGFSIVTALVLAVVPFVLTALIVVPGSRRSLLLLTPVVLLGVFAAASSMWSDDVAYGSEKFMVWAVNGVIPMAAVLVLYTARGSISWRLILIASVLYALAIIVLGSPWSGGPSRLTLLDLNPIWTARAVMVGALVSVLGPFSLVTKVVTFSVLVVACALTLSLGPVVGMVAGILAAVITALVIHARRSGRLSPWWLVFGITSGFGLVILLSGVLDPIIAPLIDDPNVSSRWTYLDASLSLLTGSPVFGIGIGGFAALGLDNAYPHNLFLEVMLEIGIIGLAGLVGWLGLAIVGASRSPMLMGLVVGTAVFTLFSGSLSSQQEFWMISAIAVASAPAVLAARRSNAGTVWLSPPPPTSYLGPDSQGVSQPVR